ncbi:MAG: hypothetical protein ACXABO_00040 [Promethearchaeota archaeon]|jgi:hypothetical protein
MPKAIILYEIDESFGPNILGEYYLIEEDKIPSAVLKEFSEKHVKKGYNDITIRKDNNRYYSNKVNAESIDRENLYLGFILQEGEDLLSLKSIFDNIEKKVIKDFSKDKTNMNELLKDGLNTILSLIKKLQEPKIIKEILNERTKKMLDEGMLQEARVLIDLGEDIPEKLAVEVKIAQELLINKDFKKAKKTFLKASELAVLIQEDQIASFLENKGEQVGTFPDLIKERENINKEILKVTTEIESNKLYLYDLLEEPVDRLIEIYNDLEENEAISELTKIKNDIQRASRLARELNGLKNKIRENLSKI